ncbi:MAG: GtrA family protein [Clostridiales bacterium]|nr:GtrA family protein [Clostridiales bacterium]
MSTNEQTSGLKKLMKSKKFQELFWYFVFGVLTTLVNLIAFALLDKLIDAKWQVKLLKWEFDFYVVFMQSIAWIVAIVFAYVTNKLFVFHTKGNVVKEFIGFVAARLFTFFAFELGLFSLSVMIMENAFAMPKDDLWFSIFGFEVTNIYIVKIFISVFVVVANYVFSKIFIFKKDKKSDSTETPDEKNGENASEKTGLPESEA